MTDQSINYQNVGITSKELEQQEDSSYDSDNEAVNEHHHQDISRTTSETLGQEDDEYDRYTQRVEFALKLGYSERLVQLALERLTNPTQNELLAELIKLGAQTGSIPCDFGTEVKEKEIAEDSAGEQDISGCLRPIVIDGSNVAMSHGNKEVFSCLGIRLAVDWFKQRGHKDITVFVPKFRKENARPDNPIKDQDILTELEKERILVFTPSRSLINGKRQICYDDRYVLKLAVENDGIVVSNDNYRDLLQESCEFKKVVEERILMYSFVNDRFMPPDDPNGKLGPTLDKFLKMCSKKIDQTTVCPYGKKKCTYGNKCKFFHPERGSLPHKSVTEQLSDFANYHLQARNSDINKKQVQGKSLSVPLNNNYGLNATNNSESFHNINRKQPLCRTSSNTQHQNTSNNPLGPPSHMLSPGNNQWDMSLSANTSPTNIMIPQFHQQQQQHSQFPKSHSIENLPYYQHQTNYTNKWTQPDQMQQQQQQHDMSLNLHKKLQRQLTLNPCDPRLFQMQHYASHAPTSRNSADYFHLTGASGYKVDNHKPLTETLSGGQNLTHSSYGEHLNVHRIASAPNSSAQTWSSSNHLPSTSTSEPHMPLVDQRNRLHYHLSNIFPKKTVEAAMNLYPDDLNPQKICSAILQNLKTGQL